MRISIITINYNDVEGLKKTMQSVLSQSYQDIEYIVIDGGSTDGSTDFINQHAEKLAYRVSENDSGIYNAMNKGIDQATGAYLLFLNSGDCLLDNLIIEKFVMLKPIEGIVYGDHLVQNRGEWQRQYMPKTMSVGIALTNTINHQSIFYASSIFVNNRYSLDYNIIADWVLTNNAIIFNGHTTRYIDLVICYYDINGISSDFQLRHKERKQYLNENFDPLFLKLLKDYKVLNKQHNNFKNRSLVKFVRWLFNIKNKIIQ